MTPLDTGLPLLWQALGLITGLVLTLSLASFLVRDSWLARAAQYLLVGVGFGYAGVLAWSNILWPRLVVPLFIEPQFAAGGPLSSRTTWELWVPLGLGLLLWVAGLDYLGRPPGRNLPRRILRFLGLVPIAIGAGTAIGAGIAGVIQGTFLPQVRRAIALGSLDALFGDVGAIGLLTLFITGGAIIHLHFGSGRELPPAPLGWLVRGWGWVGLRALWIASGVLFARLIASRLTLLIARLDDLLFGLPASEAWQVLRALLQGGGG